MKKIIDFFIIVMCCGICFTGCGKGNKVNDKQDFKVDGISEINVNIESWELKHKNGTNYVIGLLPRH